jgi:hypothetical protein
MKTLSFGVGISCLLYVGLGLLAGLLPVSVWSYILDLFIERDPNTFYKVVPTGGSDYQIIMVTVIGIVLIAYGRLKFKSN